MYKPLNHAECRPLNTQRRAPRASSGVCAKAVVARREFTGVLSDAYKLPIFFYKGQPFSPGGSFCCAELIHPSHPTDRCSARL